MKHKRLVGLLVVAVGMIAATVCLTVRGKIRVWGVTMVPTSETTLIQSEVAGHLQRMYPNKKVVLEKKSALGSIVNLKRILAEAESGGADSLIVFGIDAARVAYNEIAKTPAVYCQTPFPEQYGLLKERPGSAPFVGIVEENHAEEYCRELKLLKPDWGNAGVILPKGYLAGEAECDAFAQSYKAAFGSDVQTLVIDAKTCAQLMDVVGAYNMIISQNASLYYAISDGNLAKYLGMLITQSTRRKIPVIGGDQAVVELGGILAIVPDTEAFARQCATMLRKMMHGERVSHERVREYRKVWNMESMRTMGFGPDAEEPSEPADPETP